jgi:thiazole synthase
MEDKFSLAGEEYASRLLLGTGKYADLTVMEQAIAASGSRIITVAVRRVDLADRSKGTIMGHIDQSKYKLLPNTAGCYTEEEAIRAAHLGREVSGERWVKLEVIGDDKTLMPDCIGLVNATAKLVKDGFIVLPYTSDDLVIAKRLIDAGASAVMPLAAPIGSGMGVQNRLGLELLMERVREYRADIPIIVDAGVGTASDGAVAMELGADGVLMNTGIAGAKDPVSMARAMKLALEAGRLAYLAGRIPRKRYATASSPIEGVVR